MLAEVSFLVQGVPMKSTWKKYLLYAVYILIASGLLYGLYQLILAGYSVQWTGFDKKTLWDWMELLIIPLVLALGAIFLNRSERAVEREAAEKRAELEREIAKDHQQEAALQTYISRMSELLLKEKLRTTNRKEVSDVARTLTISIMRGLDKERNDLIVQFLREAKLIIDEKSILNEADMERMNLQNLNLSNAFLQKANLFGAFLQNANLEGANLSSVNLDGANLQSAKLWETNLSNASLSDADFSGAAFMGTDLSGTRFWNTNLSSVNIQNSNFVGANLEGANLSKTIFWSVDLSKARLQKVILRDAVFHGGGNLQGVELHNADLSRAFMGGSNLQKAILSNAILQQTMLSEANLQEADLHGADLEEANLLEADLRGVNLKDAKITPEQLAKAKSLKGATMPDGTIHE